MNTVSPSISESRERLEEQLTDGLGERGRTPRSPLLELVVISEQPNP